MIKKVEKITKILSNWLIAIGIMCMLLIYNAFAWGYVNYLLYNWFILPSIMLPKFTILEFIGFTLFISTLIRSFNPLIKDKYKEKFSIRFIIPIISPWFSLICAWLIKIILF